MIEQLPSLLQLMRQLQQVPYLASKNIYRVMNHLLSMNPEQVALLCRTIAEAKANIVRCDACCAWQEKAKGCLFCLSHKRDKGIICVVETWHELIAIEKTGGYQGVYHVLGGAICPLEGVGPEDLSIEKLVARVGETIKEVILATNQTPEGEATAAYIAGKLKNKQVKISCLARGIPVGSSLEFIDHITVYKALAERRPF